MQSTLIPEGYVSDSLSFLQAAKLLLNHQKVISLPAYFLLARCIELGLKAFLLSRGVGVKMLRSRNLGHNLSALYSEAIKHGIKTFLTIDHIELSALELLSIEYEDTKLAYRMTGELYKLPMIDVIECLAEKFYLKIFEITSK